MSEVSKQMHDQANDLRRLVQQCWAARGSPQKLGPRLVLITGGKGGVGTTTFAVNLAVTCRRQRWNVVLVDFNSQSGNVAWLCRIRAPYTLADVLSGRRTVADVLQETASGIRVLPGVWGLERVSDYPAAAADRVLAQLHSLTVKPDLIVVDAGNHPQERTQRLMRAAAAHLVVTTPENPAILDTYLAIKGLAGCVPEGWIGTVVNQAANAHVAADTYGRLREAAQRFLGLPLEDMGYLPRDPAVAAATVDARPFVLSQTSAAARHMEVLAKKLAEKLLVGSQPLSLATCTKQEKQEDRSVRNHKNGSTSGGACPIGTEQCR